MRCLTGAEFECADDAVLLFFLRSGEMVLFIFFTRFVRRRQLSPRIFVRASAELPWKEG